MCKGRDRESYPENILVIHFCDRYKLFKLTFLLGVILVLFHYFFLQMSIPLADFVCFTRIRTCNTVLNTHSEVFADIFAYQKSIYIGMFK